jgi:hypothetical protein
VFLLVFLLIGLGALYQYTLVDDDHPAMKAVLLVAFLLAGLAGVLNRLGSVAAAGLLLVALADLALPGVVATAVGGRLDVLHLGAFYLLVGSELVAGSVLAPWSVFPVGLVNSALVLATIALMPHTPTLARVLAPNDAQQAYAGPIVMQLIVAVVAYLWAQSTLRALRRADSAEEIAELERRELERTHELEEGAQQLLAVHVQLANGNFNVRVPTLRNPLLWQVGSSLNNLIGRLARLAQADFLLRRTQEEADYLTEAVQISRSGRQPIWPAPSGTPLDDLVAALSGRGGPSPSTAPNLGGFPQPPAEWASPASEDLQRSATPEWLFPQPPAAPSPPSPPPTRPGHD